jgi:hypothetical protein
MPIEKRGNQTASNARDNAPEMNRPIVRWVGTRTILRIDPMSARGSLAVSSRAEANYRDQNSLKELFDLGRSSAVRAEIEPMALVADRLLIDER